MQVEDAAGAVTTYTYNALQQRVGRDVDGDVTQFLWDGVNLRQESQAGVVEADYTLAPQPEPQPYGDLVSQHRDTESSFYHFDALGSTRVLTDAGETVTDEATYRAFGETAAASGTTANPFGWVGRPGYYQDEETGLADLRRRKYDPATGAFTTEDPLGFQAESNFYRYAGNDPVTRVDPSGYEEPWPGLQSGPSATADEIKQALGKLPPDDANALRAKLASPSSGANSNGVPSAVADGRDQQINYAHTNLPNLRRLIEQLDDLVERINEAAKGRRYREWDFVPYVGGPDTAGVAPTGRILYDEMGLQEKVWRKELKFLLHRITETEERLGTTVEELGSSQSVSAYNPTFWQRINSWLETPARPGVPEEAIGKPGGRALKAILQGSFTLLMDLPGVLANADQTLMDFQENPEAFLSEASDAIHQRALHLGNGDEDFGYNQIILEIAAGEILTLGAGKLTRASALRMLQKVRNARAALKALRERRKRRQSLPPDAGAEIDDVARMPENLPESQVSPVQENGLRIQTNQEVIDPNDPIHDAYTNLPKAANKPVAPDSKAPAWKQYEQRFGGQQTPMTTTFQGKTVSVRLDKSPTNSTIIDFKDYNWWKSSYQTPFIQEKVAENFAKQIAKYKTIRPNVHLQFSQEPPSWVVDVIRKAGGTYSVVP